MKRMHIHIGVENLDKAITFYNALFGAEPSKIKTDYAKWMLDDPRVNFAISTRIGKTGVDHLGIQVDEDHELNDLRDQLKDADLSMTNEGEAACCYARSDKSWIEDPAGIAWEAYRTMEDIQVFNNSEHESENACCTPTTDQLVANKQTEESSGCCA